MARGPYRSFYREQARRTLNVLFLTNNPNLGSTSRSLQSWLGLGRHMGLSAVVVAPRPGAFVNWLTSNGFDHLVDPMPWPDRKRPIRSFWHAWRVARWARRFGVDVIHCNEHDTYPFARMVRRFLNRPIVCHVRFRLDRGFAEWAFGKGRQPDYLLWTSEQQRADSAAAVDGLITLDRQEIVYLGLDLATFGTQASGRAATRESWGFEPNEVVIGTASALRPIKRLGDFIDLVARLASEDSRVVGVLAGDAPSGDEGHRAELLSKIEATGLGRRFRWVGDLEPVEPFYHGIDVFVSTSEYETFGNSVCEAMACARPVVAYRGGSVHEVVGDAGRIVETGDLPALTSAVRDCVNQPQLREELGQRARERVAERFNPAKWLQVLITIYRRLISPAPMAKLPDPFSAAAP